MNDAMRIIFSMSLSGGIIIILLVVLQFLSGQKLSRQWQYYIWLVAVVRLLVPFAPQQNLMNLLFLKAEPAISSIRNTIDAEMPGGQQRETNLETADGQTGEIDSKQKNTMSQKTDAKPQKAAEPQMTSAKTSNETPGESAEKASYLETLQTTETADMRQYTLPAAIFQYLWIVWIVMALFLFIRKIAIYKRFIKSVRARSEEVQDIALLEHLGRLVNKSRIKRTVSLAVNDNVFSPMLIGFFRPCIVLPSVEIPDLDFEHTVMHELIHHKRRDIFYKWLMQIVSCIHWFNPLVYILQAKVNKDCELSCDEAVLQQLNIQERFSYGDTLLRAAGGNTTGKNYISSVSFSETIKNMKERLDAIMNYQKKTKTTYIITALLTAAILACSAYIGLYSAGKQNAAAKTQPEPVSSGTSSADTASKQAAHSVLYRDGEYFILFGNATEKDLPGSTGPDYGITFGAVWPDSYVSFNSYYINSKLTKKIEKDCRYFQQKGWLTKKEVNAIVAVAAKVQKGDTKGFQTAKLQKEYAKWGITRKNYAYYYKNQRIRIFMDTRQDGSFHTLNYDGKGKADIKIVRDKNGSIQKVKYLSKKKAKEILRDLKD